MLVICGAKHQPDTAPNLPFIDVASIPPPFGFTDGGGELNTVINAHMKYPIAGLAYAVDHGAAGAQEALARIRASSAWKSSHAEAKHYPAAGVVPRG
jgi:hypothetical protein